MLCRKKGIKSIKIDNIELELDDKVEIKASKPRPQAIQDPGVNMYPMPTIGADNKIITNSLTPEQMLMWSVENHQWK